MTALGRQLLVRTAKIYDMVAMAISFGLAAALVVHQTATVSFTDFFSIRIRIRNFALFAGLLLVWHIIFCLFGLYDSRRLSARRDEVLDIVKATTLGVVFICSAAFVFQLKMVTPPFVVEFWFISNATAISSRLIARQLQKQVRLRGRNLREMLIVGTNSRAIVFARKIGAMPTLGYRLLGFVDQEWAGIAEFRTTGYPQVCGFDSLPEFIRKRVVDEVVIALPMKSMYYPASRIAALCQEQGITVRLLPNFFNLRPERSRAERFDDLSVITLCSNSTESWQHLTKRILDIAVSFACIIIFAPLFPFAALLIKLSSPGPVFFIQERVGLNKRQFRMFKFRTMVQDAEQRIAEIEEYNEVSGPVFKIKNDPRVTSVGRILRATSIDELPQLFSVFKGDMSLVGPRPLPVRDYERFNQDWQRRRFSVRPGITCLWQINGRSSIPFDKWMELDMQYIDRWSLWLDFTILAKTVPAVLKRTGAV
jgi:exopolysaccharide biosynthesis polyprenyl glycosylphosphotransferase